MRNRALLWRIGLLVIWIGALFLLIRQDGGDGIWYAALGAPLTVVVGAAVDRWWVVLAPLAVTVVLAVMTLISRSSCGDCYEEETYGFVIVFVILLFTLPAILALGTGVAMRRITRYFRRLPPAEQHT